MSICFVALPQSQDDADEFPIKNNFNNVDRSSTTKCSTELDLHRRIRLINYIQKHKLTPSNVGNLTGSESFFTSDEYLIPVIEDDPLFQLDFDDWSDDDKAGPSTSTPPSDLPSALRHIQILDKQLPQAQNNFIAEIINDPGPSAGEALRDDDIHAVMIQDKVRTASYTSFILTNPILFRDAIVLDVGCRTGVLSLFAAKSGPKHVYAIEASGIAEKAKKIVHENGLQNVVTVIRGKVEEISLPDGVDHVDIIISEWMGYALLYELMLDSVLHARDRFLRPNGGVMAPSQCRMMLALCEGSKIVKDRVDFWNDVLIYKDAIVDVVSPESVVSEPYLLKDLHLQTITSRQLEFTSPLSLTSTSPMHTKIHALVLYFDTFFTTTGEHLSPDRRASIGPGMKEREDKRVISFSTGPTSQPTHWMQTLFCSRTRSLPRRVGTVVSGTFYCKKSEVNSRELDVEIHYSVHKGADAPTSEVIVQMYKVH
ncbi:S-adenosyl-L-methionine-dependent methyltransferase [Imleria badia]|nr:S-adenosyl-L-methionine-dependent methyltransferase [Imleria badia]